MKFELKSSLDSYFKDADESTNVSLNSDDELIGAIRIYYTFFVDELFIDKNQLKPFTAMMALNSFMLFLASVRVSLSGHEAATFPIFRTSLEAACYAFLIGEESETENVWLSRHKNEEALKACRRKFTSAVKDTAKKIETLDFISPGTREWINNAYDGAIDFGAHPNPRSVLPHMKIDEDRVDGYVGINLVGLHSPNSHEHNRSMMACLDYGLIVMLILICCVKPKSDDLILGFRRMNDLKEKLSVELFGMEPIHRCDLN